jgi:hypothetical protein
MDARVVGAFVIALFGPRVAVADDATPTDPKAPPPAAKSTPDTSMTSPQPPEPEVRDRRLAGLAVDHFTFDAFGFVRLQYIAVQNDPNVAFVGRDDGFELQNARFGFAGTYREMARYVIAIDGAVDERAQINTPQGKLAVGLRDAYVDVALAGKVSTYRPETLAFLRGGYFQAWVDPESLVPDTTRQFVDHPIESRGMRSTEGYQTPGLPPGRSMGVALRVEPHPDGKQPGFGFEIAAQNGADEFSSNNDNDKPAVSATVLVRLPREGWAMAAARYNPRSVGALPFRQDEDDLQGTAGVRAVVGPVALGGGVVVQRTSFPTTGGPVQNAFGGHVQAMIDIPAPLPLAAGYRFGILDPSSLISTDRVMEHTAGAVLGVPSYRMRVQLQATHVVEQAARGLSNDRIQLAAELAL